MKSEQLDMNVELAKEAAIACRGIAQAQAGGDKHKWLARATAIEWLIASALCRKSYVLPESQRFDPNIYEDEDD